MHISTHASGSLSAVRRGRIGAFAFACRMLRSSPAAAVALCGLAGVVAVAITAPALTPVDPTHIDVERRLIGPFWTPRGTLDHPLGTDALGRDVFSRIVYGSRISLLVGVVVVSVSGTLGVILGLIAGYRGHGIGEVIMRLADIQLAFPFLLSALAVLAVLGPGLVNVIAVLAVWSWVPYARVVRGQVLALREKEFVEASRSIGAGPARVIFRHILPNVWAPIMVMASFSVANTILAEGALSFLGMGVPTSISTWGGILSDGRNYISVAWWIVTFPGMAIMLTVLCINTFGDWMRDYLDPRLRV
jgi:peptide/nickel transport system permease protein